MKDLCSNPTQGMWESSQWLWEWQWFLQDTPVCSANYKWLFTCKLQYGRKVDKKTKFQMVMMTITMMMMTSDQYQHETTTATTTTTTRTTKILRILRWLGRNMAEKWHKTKFQMMRMTMKMKIMMTTGQHQYKTITATTTTTKILRWW